MPNAGSVRPEVGGFVELYNSGAGFFGWRKITDSKASMGILAGKNDDSEADSLFFGD